MKYLQNFLMSVLAGILIGIGGIIFLTIEEKIIGSIFFSIGLLTILTFKLNLFTGKAPYICQNKPSYILDVLLIWLGNFVGTGLTAFLVSFTRIKELITNRCISIVEIKLEDSLLSLFILSIFCGIMMYIAVDTYNKRSENKNFVSGLIVVLCVSVFILAGFEHSVADMFYFWLVSPLKKWIIPLFVITIGNVVGGNIFCYIIKEYKMIENNKININKNK